ncbi:hypothetical protein, partial [Tolypothrix sp. VBCCA 56010]|uniref:hypothetical protein n=1 Tax=Tolypothrix sp. VBCCA 56010 TaxID=3137731 RepID=UPI003D7E1DD6
MGAVVCLQGEGEDRELIGYYTGERHDEEALGTFLSTHLPGYMIPSGFVWIEKIPLTSHGKTDYRS